MKGSYLILAGGLALLTGAFLPWVTVSALFMSRSVTGIESDGLISAAIGVVLILIAMLWNPLSRAGAVISFIFSGLMLWMLGYKYSAIGEVVGTAPEGVSASVGIGLHVSTLGAILVIIGAFVEFEKRGIEKNAAEKAAKDAAWEAANQTPSTKDQSN